MFEQFWNGILELTAKFVIPDWGSVIAMLPVVILALSVLVLAILFWKLARAPKPGRGKRRVTPIAPPGVHMPGPSWSPVFAAVGTFLLFLGLVFGGPILVLGAIGLALTLLYWLVESLRIYEHDVGATAPPLPVAAHDGPPPGVHMPGPSFLPFLGAIGMAMLFLGLVFGEWLLAVGLIAFVLSIVGWMTAARKEYVKTVEADSTGHLEALPDPRTPRALLAGLAILLAAGLVVQAGWLPPREASGAGASGAPPGSGAPPASGEPGASGAPPPSGPAADVTITAQGVAFVEKTITAPADKPFTIAFVNDDQGTPHNVALHEGSPTGREAFKGEIFPGVATKVYEVPPLPAGTYGFVCTVHPNMTGTATLQ
jgi:plastocyanin